MRFRPLDQRLAKTYFLCFLRRYPVSGDVIDPVLGPDELADPHAMIMLRQEAEARYSQQQR